jgi:hypothetical protein
MPLSHARRIVAAHLRAGRVDRWLHNEVQGGIPTQLVWQTHAVLHVLHYPLRPARAWSLRRPYWTRARTPALAGQRWPVSSWCRVAGQRHAWQRGPSVRPAARARRVCPSCVRARANGVRWPVVGGLRARHPAGARRGALDAAGASAGAAAAAAAAAARRKKRGGGARGGGTGGGSGGGYGGRVVELRYKLGAQHFTPLPATALHAASRSCMPRARPVAGQRGGAPQPSAWPRGSAAPADGGGAATLGADPRPPPRRRPRPRAPTRPTSCSAARVSRRAPASTPPRPTRWDVCVSTTPCPAGWAAATDGLHGRKPTIP